MAASLAALASIMAQAEAVQADGVQEPSQAGEADQIRRDLDEALDFTKLHHSLQNESIELKEALCLRRQLPRLFTPIQPGDLLAGRLRIPLVGVSPEPGGFGWFCRFGEVTKAMDLLGLDAVQSAEVLAMMRYWEGAATTSKVRGALPRWAEDRLPSDNWQGEAGAAFPLYRLAGSQLDFERLLHLGLKGLEKELAERHPRSDEESRFLAASLLALESLEQVMARYEVQARSEGLTELADVLAVIRHEPPHTLHQALQLMWIYALASGTWNYGRLDDLLGHFLDRDLLMERLNRDAALQLLISFWNLVADYDNRWNNRIIVGGKGRRSEREADQFALLAIEATRRTKKDQPQLSLRFHKEQDPALWNLALQALGEGATFPILYDDDHLIPAVAKAFGVSSDEAEQYLPYGCGEYMLWHTSISSPNAVLNLAKCFELALNNGREMRSGKVMGPQTGDPAGFSSIEDVWGAYTAQVEWFMQACAMAQKVEYEVAGREAPFLLISLLTDDCLARGRALLQGGVRHLTAATEVYGMTTVSDSFSALDSLIFKGKKHAFSLVLQSLRDNWVNHTRLRAELVEQPKFGNDNAMADAWAVRVHEHACHSALAAGEKIGLESHHIVNINNSANTDLGRFTGATPDGREAGQGLSNGNSPAPGMDRHGLTALLNSMTKLRHDIHAGSVQNMKFSRTVFNHHLPELDFMLKAYFEKGGCQAMITVVSRQDLEMALENPSEWGHLMVRVGGFSARFVDLPPEVQKEILQRTLYD